MLCLFQEKNVSLSWKLNNLRKDESEEFCVGMLFFFVFASTHKGESGPNNDTIKGGMNNSRGE